MANDIHFPNTFGSIGRGIPNDNFAGEFINKVRGHKMADQELMSKELENIFKKIRNKHEEPRLRGEIAGTKAQTRYHQGKANELEATNPFIAPKAQSDIRYNQARAAELETTNPFIGQRMKSDTDRSKIQAQQDAMLNDLLRNAMQQHGGQAGQSPANPQPEGQFGNQPNAQQDNKGMEGLFNNPAVAGLLERKFGIQSPMNHLTPKQKELSSIYGYNSPEYKEALEREHGILKGADVPEGAIPLELMPPGERNEVTKGMRVEHQKAQKLVKANKILGEMEKIVKTHPNMADEFASSFADPSEKPSVLSKIKRNFANKKDLAAFEKFTKLSNDLVLQQADAMGGGKAFTDAKMQLIRSAKPAGHMTDESLNYIINHMRRENAPAVKYGQAIEHALQNRYSIPLNMESHRQIVGITPDGRKVHVSPDEIEEFISAGGKRE